MDAQAIDIGEPVAAPTTRPWWSRRRRLAALALVIGAVIVHVFDAIDIAGMHAQEVLVRADAAMYAAKALGKGTFAVFDSRMPVRTWTELEAAG